LRFSLSTPPKLPSPPLIRRQTNTNATSPPETNPAEEAAARAQEKAEQDALPYKWTQTIEDLDITISVPGNLKGRDLVVDIKKDSITAGIKGQEPILKVRPLFPPHHPTPPSPRTPLLTCDPSRAHSPTQSAPTTALGPSPAPPKTPSSSRSTSTRPTRWSGGRTSSPRPPKST
jgi:hypothetical protein